MFVADNFDRHARSFFHLEPETHVFTTKTAAGRQKKVGRVGKMLLFPLMLCLFLIQEIYRRFSSKNGNVDKIPKNKNEYIQKIK